MDTEQERRLLWCTVTNICDSKNIDMDMDRLFEQQLCMALSETWAYKQQMGEIDKIRATAYDSNNQQHEQKLLEFWKYLMPDTSLTSRVSNQWQIIGFQSDDPKTDFRGLYKSNKITVKFLSKIRTKEKKAVFFIIQFSKFPFWKNRNGASGIRKFTIFCKK